MGLFDLPPIKGNSEDDTAILKKRAKKTVSNTISKKGNSLVDKIATINSVVSKYLGEFENLYGIIRDENTFIAYIDDIIKNGIYAIDTETTGLNTLEDKIVGFSLYTPNNKSVYIPLLHIDYITNQLIENQLSYEFIKEQLNRIKDIKAIMFNADFDFRMIKHNFKVELNVYWDSYIATKLLNENEINNGLKTIHNKYCGGNQNEVFSFDSLFKGIVFSLIPIKTGYLYAANDALITFELYEYQKQFLNATEQKCIDKNLQSVAEVFHNIEMPLVRIIADMEDIGIELDKKYLNELSVKYNRLLKEKEDNFYALCDKYNSIIEKYKQNNPNNKLDDKINIASPTQIAILLYDVLNEKSVPRCPLRGTGEDVLKQMDNEFVKPILEYREVAKLITTYIDKMIDVVNPNTGRVHCRFNQVGTVTGRFSSSNPNLQNIPSKNKDIRKIFKAKDNYCLMSADYSQQEPRLTAHMSNDIKMIQAYIDGKDIYSEIASLAFNLPYDECIEFRKDGTTNLDGKVRRGQSKAIVLGICYGKEVPSIAHDLGITKQKAQEVYDRVMSALPNLKQFMLESQEMARKNGYVLTNWGRKRRLPNMQLQPYEFDFTEKNMQNVDPLDFDSEINNKIDCQVIDKYTRLLNKAYGKYEKDNIKAKAKTEGIIIKDNGGYIAEAIRQCVNSRIQGSAGDQIKLAMKYVATNTKLKELGFKLLLTVHDELIGECPIENAKKCKELFIECMLKASDGLKVPFKCDIEISSCWTGDSIILD